jgi:hypothetical protein
MVLSIVLVVVYYALPPNQRAPRFVVEMARTFPGEWHAFQSGGDAEQRMRMKYRMNYDAPMFLRSNLVENDRIQLPPREYLGSFFPDNQLRWVEPRFIYYIAGPVRTVPWTGQLDPDATHALFVEETGKAPVLRTVQLRDAQVRKFITDLYSEAEVTGK